jgi:hypothetical protein
VRRTIEGAEGEGEGGVVVGVGVAGAAAAAGRAGVVVSFQTRRRQQGSESRAARLLHAEARRLKSGARIANAFRESEGEEGLSLRGPPRC